MKTHIYLTAIIILFGWGCRNKTPNLSEKELQAALHIQTEETAKPAELPDIPEGYIPPAGMQLQAKWDTSKPLIRLDIVSALKHAHPLKISDIGKELVYYRIEKLGKGSVKEIVPIPDGFLVNQNLGMWLLKKDFSLYKMLVEYEAEIIPADFLSYLKR